jgi:Skp family chaperone for outer membrane proteins
MDCDARRVRHVRTVEGIPQLSLGFGGVETMLMMNRVGRLWGIVGIGLLTMHVVAAAGAPEKPVTGDRIVRETQEAVRATKDYTIQQKDAFQRRVQTELDEMQVHIAQLREHVKHESGKARADIQKAIKELERKSDLADKKLQDIHSATTSSWEQAKSKTAAAMDDLRDSLNRTLSHLP